MFCIYHKVFHLRWDNHNFTFYGVNETYEKPVIPYGIHHILEYELKTYNPFLQKRGYMETSAYLHIYWNNLHKDNKFIGISQYDMIHLDTYQNLKENTIYALYANTNIVERGRWSPLMYPTIRNLPFILQSYNNHFRTSYTLSELEGKPLTLWQTNIYPKHIFDKLCSWLERFVDELYPWSNRAPYETHFGSIGGYTERAIGIFNAFEIHEGRCCEFLRIGHGFGEVQKEQYNIKSFLNSFSQDIHTTYIRNITGSFAGADLNTQKSQCYHEHKLFECLCVTKSGSQSLRVSSDEFTGIRDYGGDVEAHDTRLIIVKNIVYIVFVGNSPYPEQKHCIGISPFLTWNPTFLQITDLSKNTVDTIWTPFIKNDELYFVYSYDPLVILHYTMNKEGVCNIVFKQEDCTLAQNMSRLYLHGGTNLIPYKDKYYVGACRSQYKTDVLYNLSHIIVLDIDTWSLVYVSKPIMYYYKSDEVVENPLTTIHTILYDKLPDCIQSPTSMYNLNNEFYITINVRNSVSLLYKLDIPNLCKLFEMNKPIGYWENITKGMCEEFNSLQ